MIETVDQQNVRFFPLRAGTFTVRGPDNLPMMRDGRFMAGISRQDILLTCPYGNVENNRLAIGL
jgi:hypothetical protein